MKNYIAIAEPSDDGKTWWISFPGLPGVTSAADAPEQIAAQARDALASSIEAGGVLPPAIEDGVIPSYDLAEYSSPLVVLVPYGPAPAVVAYRVPAMTEETIVAVYDTAAHADAAVADLEAANVPASAITRQPSGTGGMATTHAEREPGFWSSLFGGEPDHDAAVYDRSLASGSHVVTVKVPDGHVEIVTSILEKHSPIDIDERAGGYGLGATSTTTTTRESLGTTAGMTAAGMTAGHASTKTDGAETLQLAEEQITVGKRLVNRGTTRIRRFVVETPVEESVSLRSEHVTIERRPVSGDARVGDASFTDRTIEMTETEEEAVVGKTSRIKEEIVVRKDAAERVETVRDTVRREDVEITKDGTVGTGASRVAGTVPPVRR